MVVFAVIAPAPEDRLDAAVKASFPDNYFVIAPGQYLVADSRATTAEIAERVGASGGGVGKIFITPVPNYAGWHDKDMWEWIAARTSGIAPAPPAARHG